MSRADARSLDERALSAIPLPVVMVGPDDRILYVNDRAESFIGAARESLVRRSLGELVGPAAAVSALVATVRRDDAPVSQHGVAWPDGARRASREIDIDAAPDGDGAVVLLLQERSFAERIDRQLTHRGAARSVSGLAAMLAHEIKNPLSGIRGAAQLLERDVDEGSRELAALIRTETDRIVKLVNSMEVFSDERPPERASVNVHSVLDRVLKIARNGFGARVRFTEDYDPSLPDLSANEDQMVQVFLNLVKNAVEALGNAADPHVRLRTTFRAGIRMAVPGRGGRTTLPLEVSITDNGPGIPAELREHLFDPFVTGRVNGTGLGLALVAKIVRDHGGVVDFDTGERGTTFRVLLPEWRGREEAA